MGDEKDKFIEDDDGEMPWESAAREAIASAITNPEFDEAEGTISLWIGVDQHGDEVRESFDDYDSLYSALTELAESEWNNYVPYDKGPVFTPHVDGYVNDAIEELQAEDFFGRHSRNPDADELFASRELLTPTGVRVLRITIQNITEELVRYFAKHPEKMRDMHARKFEELVAELFRDQGYEVELTRFSKDGGFDIRAVRKTEVGIGLTLIECKRFAQDRPVGVGLIRGLHSVVEKENATNGLLVTTSYFTKGARDFKEDLKYRLSLADFNNLKGMLKRYKSTFR